MKPRKRGPKPKPKRALLSERLTIRFRKDDMRALRKVAGELDAADWARGVLLRLVEEISNPACPGAGCGLRGGEHVDGCSQGPWFEP